MSSPSYINLPSLSVPLRMLFTGYLVVASVGLMMAGAQIFLTHGMADGKLGLSVDDIVYSYYGNRDNSKLEIKLNSSMKDKASTEDRTTIIKWVRQGSSEDQWKTSIQPILEKNCFQCHGGAIAGLPNFTTYDGIKPEAKIDEGKSVEALTRVSHIHLFGISFIFFFICLIFSLTIRIPVFVKSLAIAAPFAFILVDILAWWLTKWYPSFAYMTMIGGATYNAAALFMILTSFYQMWIMPQRGGEFPDNAWRR